MKKTYDEVYRDVLRELHGKRLISLADAARYTGIKDYRTLRKHFPFGDDNVIGIVPFCKRLAGEEN